MVHHRSTTIGPEAKALIYQLYRFGYSVAQIAKRLGRSWSTIRGVLTRIEERGSTVVSKGSGRKRSFDKRDERRLILAYKTHRRATVNQLIDFFHEGYHKQFSFSTFVRVLKRLKVYRRILKKQVIIRPANIIKRVKWCRQRRKWTRADWENYIFTDECQVVLNKQGKIKIWRTKDEKGRPHLVVPEEQRQVSLMIWGCITKSGVGTLGRVSGYINSSKYIQIIDEKIWGVILKEFPNGNFTFVHDNAPVHVSAETTKWFDDNGLKASDWPPQSPDLNIIENVWRHMKIELGKRRHNILNKDMLWAEILNVWNDIPSGFITGLYYSIPDRVREVIKMKGRMTKY